MRISEHLVVQLVELPAPAYVLHDDLSGNEEVITASTAASWLRECAGRAEDGGYRVGDILLSEADWAAFCFALGYFHCATASYGA